jgi:pimeloyl-ACP methyl ester carboxylesterase
LIQSAKGIQSVFPDQLLLSDILTERGIAVSDLAEEISACNAGLVTMATNILAEDPTITLTKDAFLNSSHAEAWAGMVSVGGKDFEGPLLVLQGTADGIIPESLVTTVVNETCQRFSHRGLHYVRAESVSHVPIVYATQQLWLDWLDEQFRGSPSGDETGHCSFQHIGGTASRPLEQYTSDIGYFMQYALEAYSLA